MILLVAQIVLENMRGAYQILVDAATILYFIPFIYMYAAAIKLYSRPDRRENRSAVVTPAGGLEFLPRRRLGTFRGGSWNCIAFYSAGRYVEQILI